MIQTKLLMCCTLACGAIVAATLAPDAAAQTVSAAQKADSNSVAAGAEPAGTEVAPTVRPEIGTLLLEAQRLLGEKKTQEAADKLLAADAVASKTPYELHILARVKGALAVSMSDAGLAAQQHELASQGTWLKPAERLASAQTVAGLYYNAKNYVKAIEWIARYQQLGGGDPGMKMLLAQSHYLNADYANAAKALEAEVSEARVAAKAPPEMQLKLLADSRSRLRDDAGYTKALEALVQYYPSSVNWRTLMARLWAKPMLPDRLQLDLFRLQMATAGFGEASDYTEMAALALREGSVIEASKVLQQGYAAGLLVAGDKAGELQRLTGEISKSAAEDRNTLEKDAARARTLPDGLAMFNYGFNMFHAGQAAAGVTQMEQALTKGIARNGDLAKLRLVSVYAQLNERDKALQLLAGLAGRTEPVGFDDCVRYWTLFLRRP